jgi:PIN like domain
MPGWSGTKDLRFYDKAKDAGFQVVVTNDARQMNRKLEVEAIAKSGLHRIQYPHRQDGLVGLGLAMATVCAALPSALQELAAVGGQRLVISKGIDPGRDHRYGVRDPAVDPPKFWPQEAASGLQRCGSSRGRPLALPNRTYTSIKAAPLRAAARRCPRRALA